MWDKVRNFIDLKALIMVGSFIIGIVTTYNTVGTHSETLQKHETYLGKNYSQLVIQDKEIAKLVIKVDSVERRQNTTDSKLDALNGSIQKLNETLVRLTTIMENKK